jgi:hypothetical protein
MRAMSKITKTEGDLISKNGFFVSMRIVFYLPASPESTNGLEYFPA